MIEISWSDIWWQWQFNPVVVGLLLVMVFLYGRGLLQTRPDDSPPTSPKLFVASLLFLGLALLSPLHYLASQLFFMRVLQHLLLVSLFPATFMMANPVGVMALGLPAGWQLALQHNFGAGTVWYGRFQQWTPKGVMWFGFIAAVWLWYDPTLHQLTLERPGVRWLELSTMCLTALGHWWHITAAQPRLHTPLPSFAHMGYTLMGALPLKVPGLVLLFSVTPLYFYPATDFLGYAVDPLTQQQLGGVVVWLLGGTLYSSTALRFLSGWMEKEAGKPVQPLTIWDNEEQMLAPGVQKRKKTFTIHARQLWNKK